MNVCVYLINRRNTLEPVITESARKVTNFVTFRTPDSQKMCV